LPLEGTDSSYEEMRYHFWIGLIYKRNKLLSLELLTGSYYKKYVQAINNHEREQGDVMVSYLSRGNVG